MTKTEQRELEEEFSDIYDLINDVNEVAARLLARAEEARKALGLLEQHGEGDGDAGTPDR